MALALQVLAGTALLAATTVLAAGVETSERFALEGRGALEDCFGPNGICAIWAVDFANPCHDALRTTNNFTAWGICKCETGWLSMLQADVIVSNLDATLHEQPRNKAESDHNGSVYDNCARGSHDYGIAASGDWPSWISQWLGERTSKSTVNVG
ncbi:hypothetical protein C8A05DRAFT_39924, partial [Staphylotrichum tortipilum]